MAEYFRLIVIGHDLEAKCDVANALIKSKTTFKQFACRRRIRVQTFGGQETISGLKYVAVLTPNLNTPAWTHLKADINVKFKHKAFLYVKDNDRILVNHSESIAKIKREFPGVLVHTIDYIDTASSVETGSFYKRMDFAQKVETTKATIIDISQDFANKLNIPYEGRQEVEGRKKGENTDAPPDNVQREIISAVPTTLIEDEPKKRHIELPKKLEARDWQNYSNTLKCGRAKSNLVRVNIVGNQSAGKTTLVKLLQGLNVKCPDNNQRPTEALDVTEITSRCSEVNGIKQWEAKLEGYEDELNVQRMAEAMHNTINALTDANSDTDEPDYVLSSAMEEDDNEDPYSYSDMYSNMTKKANRDLYLKKIIGRLNANVTEDMYITYWDFAGQTTYYAAHQVFLSHSAVYILVVDLSLDFQERLGDSLTFRSTFVQDWSNAESIVFWVSSIKAFTTDTKGGTAPILIVGTHTDKLKPKCGTVEDMVNEKFDQIKNIIKMSDVACIAIDNTHPDPDDLQAIRNRVLDLGLGVIDEMIPAQWIDLERQIEEQKVLGRCMLSFDDLRTLDIGLDMPIRDDDRLEAFLGHQHCRGQLMHFPHEELKNIIILQPETLAKFLNSLMRKTNIAQKNAQANTERIYNHNGVINHAYLKAALTQLGIKSLENYITDLIKILMSLSIIHPYKSEQADEFYLMPCLLPKRIESESVSEPEESQAFQIEFPNDTMSSTFFYHLLTKLLRRWKPVEPELGQPELFNLYACFRLKSDAQQMEVKWGKSHIRIDINNFSTRTKLADLNLWEIVEVLKQNSAEIFQIYRYIATEFEIKVQCPKHTESFVSLKMLREQGEAMCYNKTKKHSVDGNDVFNRPICDQANRTVLGRRPTDRDLGRISMILGRDSSISLACRTKLYMANVEADNANMATKDKDYRRFLILERWRHSNSTDSLGDLVDLITETGDYFQSVLINRLTAWPEQYDYDISDATLDSVPIQNTDILVVSECVGGQYPFLAFELGLTYQTIEQCKYNKPPLNEVVYDLLSSWRKENPKDSTTRVLLDTAKFVGINTNPIEKRLKDKRKQ